MKNVQGTLKRLMIREGASYESLAAKMGCSRQNVWARLNEDKVPKFAGMRKILNALGYDFVLRKKETRPGEEGPDRGALYKSAEDSGIALKDFENALDALGMELTIGKKR